MKRILIALTLSGSLSLPAVAAANPILDLPGVFMAAPPPPPSQAGPLPDLDQSVEKVAGGETDAVVIVALES